MKSSASVRWNWKVTRSGAVRNTATMHWGGGQRNGCGNATRTGKKTKTYSRNYDPAGACYTQKDPTGLAGGLNLYQYAPNPLTWIDPLGLTAKVDITTFYHAGDIQGSIDPSKGRTGLDFNPSGKGGFYVTTDLTQAQEWADLVTQGRQGNRSHNFDAVSGPMDGNPGAVRAGKPPTSRGSQLAIFSDKAAALFDKFKVSGC